jgi:enamine deaminase RidA (YjgF/YER057c/UK114 family)
MIGKRVFSGSPFEDMCGYARAVVDGNMVYVSGTTGFDAKTGGFADSVEAQCEQCFANIAAALAHAGARMEQLLRIRVYVASREEFERIKPIVRRHCMPSRPANTTVICELVDPRMRVEIEVTARIPHLGPPTYDEGRA